VILHLFAFYKCYYFFKKLCAGLLSTANKIIVNALSSEMVNTSAIQITTSQVISNNQKRDYKFTIDPLAIETNMIDADTKLTTGGKMTAKEIKVSIRLHDIETRHKEMEALLKKLINNK